MATDGMISSSRRSTSCRALAALMALAGAIVATSYLLIRSLWPRWRGRSAAGEQNSR
jgi:hypothetical protein